MKNLYYATLALALMAGTAKAQRVGESFYGPRTVQPADPSVQHQHPGSHGPQLNGEREVLFTEDFAYGMAGNNGSGAWTLEGPDADVWRYTTAPPVGAYTNANEIITSPTASNGFMLFNSDSVNTDFSVDPPVAHDPRVTVTGALVSPVIDFGSATSAVIHWVESYRYCCGTTSEQTLDVSTDGGNTWPYSIDIDQGVAYNVEFSTAEVTLNITSAISADPSNVRFRFNQGEVSAYYWQIDDISIETAPDNEMVMNYGYTSQFGGGYEYGRVPQSQMGSDINVGASIVNFGGNTQTNVVVNVSLMDSLTHTEVGSLAIPVGSVPPGDTAVADGMLDVPQPMNTGIYVANFTIESDSIDVDNNPDNNAVNRYFEVTDNLYSLDAINVLPSHLLSLTSAGTNSFTDNTQDVRLLNYYEVHAPETFTGVQIYMASQTQAGSYFTVSVYDTTDVLANPADLTAPLMQSDVHVITPAEDASRIADVHFLDDLPLAPGAYFVSANMFQEDGHNLVILDDVSVPQPGIASMLWIPIDEDNQQYLYGGNGTAWAVRLSSDPSINVQENPGLEGVSMYPNPTTGLFHIRSQKAEQLTVQVSNVLGEVVETATFNGTRNTLDLSGKAAGIYTVRISNGSNFTVERIALK